MTEKFDLFSREFKLYPSMIDKYETYYQSLTKRDWRDMDEKYKDCLEERQWALNRIKEINREIDVNYRLKRLYRMIDVKNKETAIKIIKQDIKHKKQTIANLKDELDVIKNHYLPLLKIMKEELRQEKHQTFHEEVLNQLHIDELLKCKTADEVNQLLEKENK